MESSLQPGVSANPPRPVAAGRRGSVLILVVALLVLMALLGTAYISTTRVDRATSAQHSKNIQIDLLVAGVVNQVASAIQSDIYDSTGAYRPADSGTVHSTNYDNFDSYGMTTPYDTQLGGQIVGTSTTVAHDEFLSQRFPWTLNPTVAFNAAGNPPVWHGVSYPVQQITGVTPGKNWEFNSPDTNVVFDMGLPFAPAYPAPDVTGSFTAKPWFVPTIKEFPVGSGKFYPAFTPYAYDTAKPPNLTAGPTFIAADADGDGVADSGLFKLPVGTIDGVTYYAAIRILDNNSAINVNTAWSNIEFDGSGTSTINLAPAKRYPGRYYTPSSIGLAELLRTSTNLAPLNVAGQGAEATALFRARINNLATIDGVQGNASASTPHQDDGTNIPANQYQSLQDVLQQTIGLRSSNPGTLFATGLNIGIVKALPFSITDSMALAYHFGLLNPEASPSSFESTVNMAGDSFYQGAPNYNAKWNSYAVSAAGIANWYQQTFDTAGETANTSSTFLPRRSMVVASNPVSWQAPAHTIDTYALNAGIQGYLFNAPPPPTVTVASPTKTSINQAPFPDLWRAFWNAMVENVTIPTGAVNAGTVYRGSPFDLRILYTALAPASAGIIRQSAAPNIDPPTFNDPYLGTTNQEYSELAPLTSYLPTNNNSFDPTKPMATNPPAMPTDYHPARMFRSPMRAIPDPIALVGATPGFGPGTPRLNAHQTTLLRAALAAVNAEDLRDSDDDVTAQRIILAPTNGGSLGTGNNPVAPVAAEAIVYGTERQPYITEVYAETDTKSQPGGTQPPNPYGYVAIELYNPYNDDILLTNWKLVAIDRRSIAATAGLNPPYSNNAISRPLSVGATPPVAPYNLFNLVLDDSTVIADFDPNCWRAANTPDVLVPTGTVTATTPLVVPAHGYLVLENFDDLVAYPPSGIPPQNPAGHRPPVTRLPGLGPIPSVNSGVDRSTGPSAVLNARKGMGPGGSDLPQVNVACVPGLSGEPDPAWQAAPEWGIGIRSVFNRELVLLRPRRADGQYSTGIYPPLALATVTVQAMPYDERPNLAIPPAGYPAVTAGEAPYSHLRDMVPVDSFDFTGLQIPGDSLGNPPPQPEPLGRAATIPDPATPGSTKPNPNFGIATAWHYSRQTVDTNGGMTDWKFVYPGRYNANPGYVSAAANPTLANDPRPRQQGTQYTGWTNAAASLNPWDGSTIAPVPAIPLSATVTTGISNSWFTFGYDTTQSTPTSNDNIRASYPTVFKVPLAFANYTRETIAGLTFGMGRNTVGENPLSISNNPPNRYPFGGFARDGDILTTPFIGAYTIRYLTNTGLAVSPFTIAEMNPVTMDSVFAEDTDIHDDPVPNDPVTGLNGDDNTIANGGNNGTAEREQLGRFCPVRVLAPGSPLDTPDYNGYPNPYFTANYVSPSIAVNDFGFDPSYQPQNGATPARGCDWEPFWRYHWAADLLDYLTVRTPSDDYLPNYPMQKEWQPAIAGFTAAQQQTYYVGDLVSVYNPVAAGGPAHEIYVCRNNAQSSGTLPDANFILAFQCRPVKNTSDTDAAFRGGTYLQQHTEDNVPVDGLININTANWKVLSTLPLIVNPNTGLPDDNAVPGFGGKTYRQLNQEMAKVIEYYRDIDGNEDPTIVQPHGPFRSIFELNRVVDTRTIPPRLNIPAGYGYPAATLPGFQNAYGTLPIPNVPGINEANDSLGDFAPADVPGTLTPDGVRGDYKERFLQLTRISNMITTHSDSFTCYILVQGWRNAETPQAQLVVQRRVGYIMDRSRITPTTPDKLLKQAFVNN